jgi:hypothetical protein
MLKHLLSMLSLAMLVVLSSFTSTGKYNFIGTYGVCESDPSQIQLVIQSDNSFSYKDFPNPKNKISVTGQWVLKGRKVFLKANNKATNFHRLWSFQSNGKIAKSHKGLTFYRLGKMNQ